MRRDVNTQTLYTHIGVEVSLVHMHYELGGNVLYFLQKMDKRAFGILQMTS